MTFLPVSHLDGGSDDMPYPLFKSGELSAHAYWKSDPSTILELLLENVGGLQDNFPDHEQPDLNSHFFNSKNRVSVSFFQSFIVPPGIPEIQPVLIAKQEFPKTTHAAALPHLQHHNFVFRLTPF